MKPILILIFILSTIFLANRKLFAQDITDQLAVSNYETQLIPTVKIGSNISEDQFKLSVINYKANFEHRSITRFDNYNHHGRFWAAVAAGGLIICASSLLMGTIAAFDEGLNAKDTKVLYGISIGSGAIALIAIHKERKKIRKLQSDQTRHNTFD
jgi:hypothetical protein